MKNNSRVDLNLANYDVYHNFDKFWRIRLNRFRVVLLDELDQPIQSPGTELGKYIQIQVTFPTIFNDTSLDRRKGSIP